MKTVDAIVLLSGGLDSALILAMLSLEKKNTLALSFDYGQKHKIELQYAKKLARHYGAIHQIMHIDLRAPSEPEPDIPKNRNLEDIEKGGVPSTYVPARNAIFLAYALGQAEMRGAKEIHYGPNTHDKFGYPDCTPKAIEAFQNVFSSASVQAPRLATPLLHMTKEQIWEKAKELSVPIDLTLSCYDPTPEGEHCRRCDACVIKIYADVNLTGHIAIKCETRA